MPCVSIKCLHKKFTYLHLKAGVSTWLSKNRTSNNIYALIIYLFFNCFFTNPCIFRDLCKKLTWEEGLFNLKPVLHRV